VLVALECELRRESRSLAQCVKQLTQAVLGSQRDKRFGSRLAQVNRRPVGKTVIGGNDKAEPFFGQDHRFQAIVEGRHWRDEHDV
jgi:hypothetical protein